MSDELSSPETFWVALEKAPHYAARVGVIISYGSTLESDLAKMLMKIADVHGNHAGVILNSFFSVSHRLDLIQTIIDNGMPQTPLTIGMKRAVGWARETLRIRNKYAHARFGLGTAGTLAVHCWFNDPKKKYTSYNETPVSIDAEIKHLKTAYCAVHNFLFADEMPPEPPLNKPPTSRAQQRRNSSNQVNTRSRGLKQRQTS